MDLYTLGEKKCALYAVIPDNDNTFNFLVSLLYSQAFQALYYSADQIHHGALPRHVHFVLDEFAAMPLPGFTRELATMRSRNISASTIIQNMAQIKELYKDSWETIPGNSDTILYLGGNEASTHKYISEALGKATIDTRTHGQSKGRSGSWSTNFQMSGRELLTPDEVRALDNRYAILFIRGAKPVMDLKYDLTRHPAIRHTVDGGGPPYIHHRHQTPAFTGSIALCDAGTGIGKTYAYLVAGVVFRRYRSRAGLPNQPLLISTSSIALQGAIIHDYLPFLSKVMMADGMLDSPLRAVLRKGKSHYVCDARLMKRLQTANLDRKNPLAKAALLSMRDHLDLDMAPHLSGYDRERICVPPTCDCGKTECRYLCYLDVCASERYAIQVCNHNLLLADAIHRGSGKRPILPDSCAIVMDEAHKLTETARQMFGITLEAGELHTLCRKLRREQFLLAAETLEDTAGLLLSEMAKPWSGDSSFSHFSIPLDGVERTLSVIHRQIRRMLTAGTRMELERVLDKTKLFCLHQPDMVYYTAEDETGGSMLCASATDLTAQLRQTLWQQDRPMILASGTLAVGSNFRRFKEETGLLAEGRVREHIAPSPFDYQRNCLLYLPQIPPSQADSDYYDDLAEQIVKLLDAANGHALGLFTSYAAMSAVRERLKQRDLPYPVLTLGRNGGHTLSEFMAHPGSVLLAAGAAWEGFDFPGDCVSLLILPRLPFPMPDAVKEQERMKHATLHDFLRAVVVPEMQIKLRQGFGRAIRTETDTCVVAILDERAGKDRRYFRDVLTALPEVPVTHSLKDVERFIRAVKPEGYFLEGAA